MEIGSFGPSDDGDGFRPLSSEIRRLHMCIITFYGETADPWVTAETLPLYPVVNLGLSWAFAKFSFGTDDCCPMRFGAAIPR